MSDLNNAIEGIDSIVVAVPSQNVREVLSSAKQKISKSKCIINIAKGIENDSLMTMSEVINDVIKSQNYEGEIEDLIVYALVTIFLFFVVGYIGNKKNKK